MCTAATYLTNRNLTICNLHCTLQFVTYKGLYKMYNDNRKIKPYSTRNEKAADK